MERFKVSITRPAEKDLLDILSYIADILKEPTAAERIFLSIREQVLSLDHMPYRYAIVQDEPYAAMGIRQIPIENYVAFYMVDEAAQTVHILRILYKRREWQTLLEGLQH